MLTLPLRPQSGAAHRRADQDSGMKYLLWLLKAAIFFALFAFALNNQQNATVNFLFGYALTLPLVLVILGSFALGAVLGVLVMVPRWWRQRRDAQVAQKQVRHVEQALATGSPRSEEPGLYRNDTTRFAEGSNPLLACFAESIL